MPLKLNRRFITFEGGEGAGKSTQAALLGQFLKEAGQAVVMTREPGGSQGAEDIRRILVSGGAKRWSAETETLLHYAARADHLQRLIIPALDAGNWVICDRFFDSTRAYQGYGHGVEQAWLRTLQDRIVGDWVPKITFIFDLPAAIGLQRALQRRDDENRYEKMDIGFHERLREGFLEIAQAEPDRCIVIDADRDVEDISAEISRHVRQRLSLAAP